jgi:Mg-chelatase subunit ChlD
MSLTFLTPIAGVVALAAAVPLVAAAAGDRRVAQVRRRLRLVPGPPDRAGLVLLASLPLVLALAATQPALARHASRLVREDAAVFVVLDVSKSMQASTSPNTSSRLERARTAAVRLRTELPDVPVGLASFTDRVVPLLFPTIDAGAFDSTVRAAIRLQTPPPLEVEPTATSFDALGALGTQGFFTDTQRHRVVVVFTDGESNPFDPASVAADLHGTALVVVRYWSARERVYDGGTAEPDYRPDPASAALVTELTNATGGRSFDANQLGAAIAAARRGLGNSAGVSTPGELRRIPLAPWVAFAAVLPLALLLRRRLLVAL